MVRYSPVCKVDFTLPLRLHRRKVQAIYHHGRRQQDIVVVGGGELSRWIINNLINGVTRFNFSCMHVIEKDHVALPRGARVAVRGTPLCSSRVKTSLYQLTRTCHAISECWFMPPQNVGECFPTLTSAAVARSVSTRPPAWPLEKVLTRNVYTS